MPPPDFNRLPDRCLRKTHFVTFWWHESPSLQWQQQRGPAHYLTLGWQEYTVSSPHSSMGETEALVSAQESSKILEIIRPWAQKLPHCRMMGTFCRASLTRPLPALRILVTRRGVGSPRKKVPGHLLWWFCSGTWVSLAGLPMQGTCPLSQPGVPLEWVMANWSAAFASRRPRISPLSSHVASGLHCVWLKVCCPNLTPQSPLSDPKEWSGGSGISSIDKMIPESASLIPFNPTFPPPFLKPFPSWS